GNWFALLRLLRRSLQDTNGAVFVQLHKIGVKCLLHGLRDQSFTLPRRTRSKLFRRIAIINFLGYSDCDHRSVRGEKCRGSLKLPSVRPLGSNTPKSHCRIFTHNSFNFKITSDFALYTILTKCRHCFFKKRKNLRRQYSYRGVYNPPSVIALSCVLSILLRHSRLMCSLRF